MTLAAAPPDEIVWLALPALPEIEPAEAASPLAPAAPLAPEAVTEAEADPDVPLEVALAR